MDTKKIIDRFVYILSWMFIQFFRVLPFGVMQVISRFFYYIVFYLIRYRRKVVYDNIRNAFPDKTNDEIMALNRRFYKYFLDMISETIKGYTMSIPDLKRRFIALNPELTDRLYQQGRSVMMIGGHYGNHEWGKILGKQLQHPFQVVYTTFSNPYVEAYQQKTRSMYDMDVLPVKKLMRFMAEHRHDPIGYILGVDQRPFDLQNCLWVRFLNQDTPCHRGYEQLARKFNMPVVYIDIQPVRRGYYTFRTEMIAENPAELPEGYIVKAFMKRLEQSIIRKPEYWLWSHKRWKFTRPEATVVYPLSD